MSLEDKARKKFNSIAKHIIVDQQLETKFSMKNGAAPTAILFFKAGNKVYYCGATIFKMKGPGIRSVRNLKTRFVNDVLERGFEIDLIEAVPIKTIIEKSKGIIPIRQFFNECES